MAQGYTGYSIFNSEVTLKDSPLFDAFSRVRISNPLTLFSSQFTYNLNPLLFKTYTAGTGAAVTHDTTNRCVNLSFTSSTNSSESRIQTYEHFQYQPGKSQLFFISFNFNITTYISNVKKYVGLTTGSSAISTSNETEILFVNSSGSTFFSIVSPTGTSTATQTQWNIDKLDGSGPSGITLDLSKIQILVIDFQALYSGRVRVGFDLNGKITYCHEFNHANIKTSPYLQTAAFSITAGMTVFNNSGTPTTNMNLICAAVVSEGGTEDANLFAYSFVASNASGVSVPNSSTHLISIRPKTTFNTFKNRAKLTYVDLEIFNEGSKAIKWELVVGQTISSGTWADVDSTYSSTQYLDANTGSPTLSGTPIVIDSGWINGTAGGKGQTSGSTITARYPLTLNPDGTQRDLGTLTLKATCLDSAGTTVRANIKFKELR